MYEYQQQPKSKKMKQPLQYGTHYNGRNVAGHAKIESIGSTLISNGAKLHPLIAYL